ncbi:MAG: hypothetical protein WBF18_11095 [Solirubrobacterales bacterium]
MGPGATGLRRAVELNPFAAAAAIAAAVLACLTLALGWAPAIADAGIKGQAKKATKAKIKSLGAQPVKISCRVKGKRGRDGAKCKWTFAKTAGGSSVKNCKGLGLLKRKKGKLKFKQSGCKADKGAKAVAELLPAKLAKQGYEATFVFCYTTLGYGYKCKWEALSFKADEIEDCWGAARSQDKKVTITVKGCATNEIAAAAQSSVKDALAALGLTAGQINCRPGSPIKCTYEASQRSGGWTYYCEGGATAQKPEGPFSVDPCDLHAPDEAPLTPALGPHPFFGINDTWASIPGQIGRLSQLGADTARFIVNWTGVQPNPPSPTGGPSYDWTQPDTAYDAMVGYGIRPILIIQSAPCWATGVASCNPYDSGYPPDDGHLADWGDFAAAVAERYPQARAIEVWNEANADLFFRNAPRPIKYSKLLKTAHGSIKAEDPSMPVLTTGLAPFASSGPGQQRYDDFLRDVYGQGTKGYSDGIAHHAYPGSGPTGDYQQSIRVQIADLKDVMLDFGDQDKPIWITETGASNAGNKPYTEAQQAQAVAAIYKQFRRIPGIPAVVAHRWRDDASASGVLSAETGFGLQRSNGTEKPVFCVLAAARGTSPSGC